ncbi:MAG: cadherin-like domain-containing protein [Lentisphaeraceae bacterium]|nr:cadherin-like domain-containing protein [Lentisphaeraceae bacterium]
MSFIKKYLRSVGLKVKPQKLPYLLCSGLLATQLSAAPASSGIKQETWTNISGQSVSDLTAHAAYPEFPDQQSIVTDLFERTLNSGSQSGVRLSGLLKIDTTGSYNFWMASDDAGELWLSTDSDPANKIKITSVDTWTGFRSWTAQSAAIHLVAGQKYYIEAISKAGGGIDHLSVAWQGPGISQDVIPASQVEIGAAAPTAASDALAVIGGGTTAIDVLANDWSSEALSIKSFTQPANGSVSLNSKGFLQYTANVNYVGNDSFSYTVEDSSGLTAVATVEVSVNATLDLVAAQNAILSGVSSLANELVHKNYAPSRTVAYGPSAGNLYRLAHNESTAAVATWQNGRVVAVPTKLISAWGTIQSSGDTATFLTNSIDWAAQKSSAAIISSSPELASWLGGQGYSASSSASWWNELAGKDAVLISLADVDDYNDAAAIAALKTFVRAGGGLESGRVFRFHQHQRFRMPLADGRELTAEF